MVRDPNVQAGTMPASAGWPVDAHDAQVSARARHNWPLLAFVALIPLQNLYLGYLPSGPGGLNFLNLMFVFSLLAAWAHGGGLVRGSGLNGWTAAYIGMSVIALLVADSRLQDSSGHMNILKDQLLAVGFIYLAQMSASSVAELRALLLASLLPWPYLLMIVANQHGAVDSWHYSHDLRISGTFIELGANEFAAFCTTAMLVAFGLLLGSRAASRWRLLFGAAALFAGAGVVLTYSRTAYVAALLGIALIVLLRRGGMRLLLPAALALALLPVLLPNSVMERFDSIAVESGTRDESTELRFAFWEVAREQVSRNPMLGTGFHSFQHAEVNPLRTDTHNFFLRELAEKGFVGAAVLLGLLLCMARMLWFALRTSAPGSFANGLALGLAGAFVALLTANGFGDRFTHYPMIAHFWLYLGLLLRALSLPTVPAEVASNGPR